MANTSPSQRARLRVPLLPVWLRGSFVVATLGVLVYYSVVPAPGSGSVSAGPFGILPYSTWLHLLAYMGLAVVFAYATAHLGLPTWQQLALVFIIVVSIGATIELVQYTLPTRTFSWLDIVTNAIGASVGLLGWAILDRIAKFYHVDATEVLTE